MATDYSKREIDGFLQRIDEKLDRIETQTTKTNGNVRTLQIWRAYLTGGLAILSILIVPIILIMVAEFFD